MIWNLKKIEYKKIYRYGDLPKDTIYTNTWLKRKKIQIPKNYNGTYDYDEVNSSELNELKSKRESRGILQTRRRRDGLDCEGIG